MKVLLDPSVSVELVGYRPMFILGEVTKPGQYPYEPGMTVLTAVAIAGGFTYRAKPDMHRCCGRSTANLSRDAYRAGWTFCQEMSSLSWSAISDLPAPAASQRQMHREGDQALGVLRNRQRFSASCRGATHAAGSRYETAIKGEMYHAVQQPRNATADGELALSAARRKLPELNAAAPVQKYIPQKFVIDNQATLTSERSCWFPLSAGPRSYWKRSVRRSRGR